MVGMRDMFTATLVGDRQVVEGLVGWGVEVERALVRRVTKLAILLRNHVVEKKLSGQVLNKITGALSRSIQYRVETALQAVWGFIFSAGDVKYAAIHEFGGTINHPGGTAYFVAYAMGLGSATFVRNSNPLSEHLPRTAAHQIHMPERSYMRSSLREWGPRIERELKEAVVEGLQAAIGRQAGVTT